MSFYSVHGKKQALSDIRVAEAFSHKPEHLMLTGAQLEPFSSSSLRINGSG